MTPAFILRTLKSWASGSVIPQSFAADQEIQRAGQGKKKPPFFNGGKINPGGDLLSHPLSGQYHRR
jgi:hypothetical protein